MNLVVAFLVGLAASPAPAVFVGMLLGGDQLNQNVALGALLASFVTLTALFARGHPRPLVVFRRGLLAVVAEAFFLPLLSYLVGPVEGLLAGGAPGLPGGGGPGLGVGGQEFSSVSSVIALIFGVPALVLYFVTKPSGPA